MGTRFTSIEAKSARLIADGKVAQVGALYTVEGDHGSYYVTVEGMGWGAKYSCDCPASGYCSHKAAVARLHTADLDPFAGL